MLAGSPPSAIATGMVSPRSAICRQCAAPTLCRCQCIASEFFPRTCTRYIPTFLTPDSGFFVMTPPSVMYGPPSSGQQTGTGNCVRSTSDSAITVLWHAGRLTVFGGNFAISASRGSMASLPSNPSGTFIASSSLMRSRRLASAIGQGADPAGQSLEADAREAGGAQSVRERFRRGKREHRLWQVGIGVPMFRDEPADGGENSPKVEQVDRAQRREARRREVEDDEARARLQDASRLAQPAVDVGKIAYAKSHQGAVEARRGKRQLQSVGGDGHRMRCFFLASCQHRNGKVGPDDSAAKPLPARQCGGEVERAGAEIEIGAVGLRLPAEARDRAAAPGPIHVEAEQVV